MATTYNCSITNLGGRQNSPVTSGGTFLIGGSSNSLNNGLRFTYGSYSDHTLTNDQLVGYFESLGYSGVEASSIRLDFKYIDGRTRSYWGCRTQLQDGTFIEIPNIFNEPDYIPEIQNGFGFSNLNQPVVDLFFRDDLSELNFSFRAITGDNVVATAQTHKITVEGLSGTKLRTEADVRTFFRTLGFDVSGGYNETPIITCQAFDSDGSSTGTSSTVTLSSDLSTSTVVNVIQESTESVENLQETIDNLTTQVNFINTNVVSSLNNNVQRAQEVASQANDGIVGLTFQLRDLMSRIETLENQ